MRRLFWIGLTGLALCGASRVPAIHNLSPKDADKLLAEGGVLLIDVRTPKEFNEGHIPNAKLVPITELSKRMHELSADKTQPVLVYGGSDARSAKAAHTLYRNGFKDVYNLSGGLRAWIAAQKPIQIQAPNGNQATAH
jgi:rhodanese-related sulfurtransferase